MAEDLLSVVYTLLLQTCCNYNCTAVSSLLHLDCCVAKVNKRFVVYVTVSVARLVQQIALKAQSDQQTADYYSLKTNKPQLKRITIKLNHTL